MHGPAQVAGARTHECTLCGRKFVLTTRTIGDIAEADNFILNRRPNLIAQVAALPADTPQDVAHRLMREVCEAANRARFVSWEEKTDYERAPVGFAHRLYLRARQEQPDMTGWEAALPYIDGAAPEELTSFREALDKCEEIEQIKN